MGVLRVTSETEIQAIEGRVRAAADDLQARLAAFRGDGVALLRALKFEKFGTHPLEARRLNAVEQVNQTWTWLAALAAARQLFSLHPHCDALLLAPGAHAAQALDVMSEPLHGIGAEVFAAVTPKNNGKLIVDLDKLAERQEQHRYVFFASPLYAATQRQPQLERDCIQVWTVHV
jgi:hypothetical protein